MMKEDILYYLQTVMFLGTPCIFGNILWSNTGCYKPTRAVQRGARTRSFHTFQILYSRVRNIKTLVCCSFSAWRRLCTWTRATMTEVRMKNLFRMDIPSYRMGAIRDSKVKQLFLNAKPRRHEFGGSKRPFFVF